MINNNFFIKFLDFDAWREKKDSLFRNEKIASFCTSLYSKGLRADHISLLAGLFGIFAVISLFNNPILYIVFYALNMLFDGIDGFYARITHSDSASGDLLDHCLDMIFPVLVLLKSIFYFQNWWILILLVLYLGEAIYVIVNRVTRRKMPVKIFVEFDLFKLYTIGLIVQAILQPLLFLMYVLWYSKVENYKVSKEYPR